MGNLQQFEGYLNAQKMVNRGLKAFPILYVKIVYSINLTCASWQEILRAASKSWSCKYSTQLKKTRLRVRDVQAPPARAGVVRARSRNLQSIYVLADYL